MTYNVFSGTLNPTHFTSLSSNKETKETVEKLAETEAVDRHFLADVQK